MKILIIEDEDYKLEKIYQFYQDYFTNTTLVTAKSFSTGTQIALSQTFDYAIIDMSLPQFEKDFRKPSGRKKSLGGVDIIEQLEIRESLLPFVILTQHPSFSDGHNKFDLNVISEKLELSYPNHYLGTVYMIALSSEWKESLHKIVEHLHD